MSGSSILKYQWKMYLPLKILNVDHYHQENLYNCLLTFKSRLGKGIRRNFRSYTLKKLHSNFLINSRYLILILIFHYHWQRFILYSQVTVILKNGWLTGQFSGNFYRVVDVVGCNSIAKDWNLTLFLGGDIADILVTFSDAHFLISRVC